LGTVEASMNVPEHLRYAESHEWIDPADLAEAPVGISDHAQAELSEVVYLELPPLGSVLKKGDPFGVIESVKAANDVYAPASGEVVAVNESLAEEPGPVNSDPYGAGWMVKIRVSDPAELEGLMDAQAYGAILS